MRYGVAFLFPIVAGGVVAACHLVSGVGDLSFVEPTPTTGGTTPTTSTTTGQGGSGATTSSTTPTGGAGGSGGGGGSAGSGGQGGAGGAPLCLIELEDAFDAGSLDTGLWVEWLNLATSDATGGSYQVTPTPSTAGARGFITSLATYDLTGCAVLAEIPQALNNSGTARTSFYLTDGGYDNSASFYITAGNLVLRVEIATAETILLTTPYDDAAHRWFRLREQAGTLYFETSADADVWEERATTATPSWITAAYVRLSASTMAADAPDPGLAQFDNVNVLP